MPTLIFFHLAQETVYYEFQIDKPDNSSVYNSIVLFRMFNG